MLHKQTRLLQDRHAVAQHQLEEEEEEEESYLCRGCAQCGRQRAACDTIESQYSRAQYLWRRWCPSPRGPRTCARRRAPAIGKRKDHGFGSLENGSTVHSNGLPRQRLLVVSA